MAKQELGRRNQLRGEWPQYHRVCVRQYYRACVCAAILPCVAAHTTEAVACAHVGLPT